MNYDDPERAVEFAERTRAFLDDVVVPVEREHAGSTPISSAPVAELRQEARDRGVYAPQVPAEHGGLGLDLRSAVPVFEADGRSLLGPPALRMAPPNQGNVRLLARAGTDAQRDRWLEPLVAGEVDSAFSTTEPMPGSGSDPSAMRTVAVRDGDEWVIDGHKWWTTGGAGADVLFVVARTGDDAGASAGPTLFLVPAETSGVEVVREIPTTASHGLGGHAEIRYDSVRVPESALLGEPGEALDVVGRHRSPASRVGRCGRQVGMARRALDVATAYAAERRADGGALAEKQSIRFELATVESRLSAARALLRRAADAVVEGSPDTDGVLDGSPDTDGVLDGSSDADAALARASLVVGEAVEDAVGTAVQVCGANGVGKDLPLSDFYEAVRPSRSDVGNVRSKRTVADDLFDDVDPSELDPVVRFRS